MRLVESAALSLLVALGLSVRAGAQAHDEERFALELEAGTLWQSRNDVRIPNATGTEFSVVDLVGTGPYGAFRVEAAFDLNERHGFRAVVAPLVIEDAGVLGQPVLFAGESFVSGVETRAQYKFSSYRFTYRYAFHRGETWRWRVGFTGFIRDARVALEQGDHSAEDVDVGFVPLAHLDGRARLSDRWRLLIDFDGLAASQGRAFDVAVKLGYVLSDDWELAFGYRTIEGGADVESVYNFAWLNFAVASVRYRF
jgi:hypothetical protein